MPSKISKKNKYKDKKKQKSIKKTRNELSGGKVNMGEILSNVLLFAILLFLTGGGIILYYMEMAMYQPDGRATSNYPPERDGKTPGNWKPHPKPNQDTRRAPAETVEDLSQIYFSNPSRQTEQSRQSRQSRQTVIEQDIDLNYELLVGKIQDLSIIQKELDGQKIILENAKNKLEKLEEQDTSQTKIEQAQNTVKQLNEIIIAQTEDILKLEEEITKINETNERLLQADLQAGGGTVDLNMVEIEELHQSLRGGYNDNLSQLETTLKLLKKTQEKLNRNICVKIIAMFVSSYFNKEN